MGTTMSQEQLLNGLTYVQQTLQKMDKTMNQHIQLERRFRAMEKGIGTKSVSDRAKLTTVALVFTMVGLQAVAALITLDFTSLVLCAILAAVIFFLMTKKKKTSASKAILAVLVASYLMNLFSVLRSLNLIQAIVLAVLIAVVVVVEYKFVLSKNSQTAVKNTEIAQSNEQVRAQRQQLLDQFNQLGTEMVQRTGSWYPRDYYTLHAVSFFIHQVRNYAAGTVQEMVKQYQEEARFQENMAVQRQQADLLNQMIIGNQQIQQQLQYMNMVQAMSYMEQKRHNTAMEKYAGDIEWQVGNMNMNHRR